MEKIVLYTKSYSGDLERLKICIESIKQFNEDNIPYYISVPSNEIEYFKNNIDCSYVNLISDDDIYPTTSQNWNTQQVIKASFWKLNLTENYVCLDSDGYFIKPFKVSDFMFDDNIPYTVIHEQKELFSWTVNKSQILGFDPKESYIRDRQVIMDIFDRKGKYYDFGPVPSIWSSKVWKSLEDNYSTPNNLTFGDLINYCPSEFSWYGESLLNFQAIPIYPVEPLFKVFHYAQQAIEYKQNNITEQMIAQNYFGIILQSNWGAPLKY